jgi:hypothetical protein
MSKYLARLKAFLDEKAKPEPNKWAIEPIASPQKRQTDPFGSFVSDQGRRVLKIKPAFEPATETPHMPVRQQPCVAISRDAITFDGPTMRVCDCGGIATYSKGRDINQEDGRRWLCIECFENETPRLPEPESTRH